MNHDELVDDLLIELEPDFRFTDDQAAVMHAYHEGTGRVCVGSGAGTGKTTTLTRVVAEAVIRLCQPNPGSVNSNPFDEILVTTFTRDAAGQLKTKIKQRLREHEENSGVELDLAIWRWIETDSNISTIDSFVGDLLQEIASEVSVAPGFDVRDEVETQELLREIVRELEQDDDYAEALELLNETLEDTTPRRYLYDIHQKLREFCYEFSDPDDELRATVFTDQMRADIYQDREPPYRAADIRDIVASVTGMSERDVTVPDDDTLSRMDEDYHHSIAFATAVDDLIDAFEAEYDHRTRSTGALSYQDITYIVWKYLNSDKGNDLSAGLSQRFSHIFIDEFQDTSYAQCQILRHLINNEEPRTDVLVIGDVKQSIYGWRSADPDIFARILEHAEEGRAGPDEYLGATEWTRTELVTNFRSHPHLVRAGNHLFDQVFNHTGLGAIGTFPVEFSPLIPHRPPTDEEQPRLHVLPLGEVSSDEWRTRDPQQTAAVINGMLEDDSVTVGDGDGERQVRAGDVTLLFRRSTHMPEFREALNDHGLKNAVVADRGLFGTEEVGFIIDVLDWFANPHSKDSLLRILRSPVTALSDRTLRFLTSQGLNLPQAIDDWPKEELPESDKRRLEGLVDLRSDLRWDREGSKADLVQKIVQHTGLETILLAGEDALQRYGNIWMLVELAKDWEDEELLPYREFVERLKAYQSMARSGNQTFEVAQVTDDSANDTIKLRTVHSSKGLEFPVVVLADLLATPGGRPQASMDISYRDPDTGERKYALRPQPAGEPIDYDDGPGSKWVRGSQHSSTLWITTNRDNLGRFRNPHPYNPAVQDDFAEFWRLLYVAVTRASDHLLLSLGEDLPSVYHHMWSTWAHPLLDAFQASNEWSIPDDGEPEEFQLRPDAMHENDDGPFSMHLDVGLLESGERQQPTPLGLPEPPESEQPSTEQPRAQVRDERVPFAPRRLTPSSLHDLIVCPKRYQYRALEEVSEARGQSPPGTNAPEGYSPSYWGTIVHEAFEAHHIDLRNGELDAEDGALSEHLERYDEIAKPIAASINTYRENGLWETVRTATTVLPEYELSAIHPAEPQVHISGIIDLLVETDDGWTIIDFKTGRPPTKGSYLADQYRSQLVTYAWLLLEEYDIEVSQAYLFYVQSGNVREYEIEPTTFSQELQQLPDQLTVETESGLPTAPEPDPETTDRDSLNLESRCGSCPYTTICPDWAE